MIELAFRQISGNVYAIPVTRSSYLYVVKGKECTLIDSGIRYPGSGNRILKELKRLDIKPGEVSRLFLTHHDLDHVGNAAMLQRATGCQVTVSNEDMPYVTGKKKRPGIKRFFEMTSHVEKPESVSAFCSDSIGEFRIIKTPGHTPGHICILYRDILFAGDLVFVKKRRLRCHSDIFTWNRAKLLESVQKLSRLSFTWVCPGDSSPIRTSEILNFPIRVDGSAGRIL